MPIINERIGQKKCLTLSFGFGDMGVAPSIDPSGQIIIFEGNKEDNPHLQKYEDVAWDKMIAEGTTDDIVTNKGIICLRFTDVTSMAPLIEALFLIQKQFDNANH